MKGSPERSIPFNEVIGRDLEVHDREDNILRGPITRIEVHWKDETQQAERFTFYTQWIAEKIGQDWRLRRDAANKEVGVPLFKGGSTREPTPLVLHENPDGTIKPLSLPSLLMREIIIHKPDDHLDKTSLIKTNR